MEPLLFPLGHNFSTKQKMLSGSSFPFTHLPLKFDIFLKTSLFFYFGLVGFQVFITLLNNFYFINFAHPWNGLFCYYFP